MSNDIAWSDGRPHRARMEAVMFSKSKARSEGSTHVAAPAVFMCRVYWGSHGCCRPQGHEGPHICDCVIDSMQDAREGVENVGAPPYYGPETRFYGEDSEAEQ
jgi:hypothetical protein